MKLKENKDIIETLIEFLNDYSIKSSLDPKNSFEIFKKGLTNKEISEDIINSILETNK